MVFLRSKTNFSFFLCACACRYRFPFLSSSRYSWRFFQKRIRSKKKKYSNHWKKNEKTILLEFRESRKNSLYFRGCRRFFYFYNSRTIVEPCNQSRNNVLAGSVISSFWLCCSGSGEQHARFVLPPRARDFAISFRQRCGSFFFSFTLLFTDSLELIFFESFGRSNRKWWTLNLREKIDFPIISIVPIFIPKMEND